MLIKVFSCVWKQLGKITFLETYLKSCFAYCGPDVFSNWDSLDSGCAFVVRTTWLLKMLLKGWSLHVAWPCFNFCQSTTLFALGCGFDSRQCPALLSFSKTLYPHCCSPPTCINGYLVGCKRYLSLDVACVCPWSGAWPECSPGSSEGALWVQDWYWIQWSGVIIHCEALWVVSHTRKALYKNQLLLQWNLVITRTLGPWRLPCYIRFLISG